jgi:murein DD-endopeptidase MepM/ murein hydrolase activator NlpD
MLSVALVSALSGAGSGLIGTAPNSSRSPGSPQWSWPVARVTLVNPYAAPVTAYASGHRGIDVAAVTGTAVTAPADGVVWFSGIVVDRPVLTLDHGNGVLSSYEPLDSSLVVGAAVHTGDPLGTVGLGAHCSASCLHVGVRVDGQYVSPLLFFSRVPRAILLPLRRPAR